MFFGIEKDVTMDMVQAFGCAARETSLATCGSNIVKPVLKSNELPVFISAQGGRGRPTAKNIYSTFCGRQ